MPSCLSPDLDVLLNVHRLDDALLGPGLCAMACAVRRCGPVVCQRRQLGVHDAVHDNVLGFYHLWRCLLIRLSLQTPVLAQLAALPYVGFVVHPHLLLASPASEPLYRHLAYGEQAIQQ